jgi:glycosyltransferase involved in cell wall biosynthesis
MLEAMPLILNRFPDAKLYIGGGNITKSDTIWDKLKRTSYGKYIEELIRRYSLESCVEFTEILDEKQMCQRYLKSNVFVCPSSIENSPNSLGEAMILGVPCVASDVGGVADMLNHREEGFVHQTDAPYMLAHYVCEIFANDELALQFSVKAKEHAMRTHDPQTNLNTLLEIYEQICNQ